MADANTLVLIEDLINAVEALQGMCGNEAPEDSLVSEWAECEVIRNAAVYYVESHKAAQLMLRQIRERLGETCTDCGAFRPRVDGKVHKDGWVCSDCTGDRSKA